MPSLRMSIIVAILTGVLALFLKMRVADFPRSSGRGLDHLEHNNTCGGAANIIRIVTRSADTGGKYFAFEETATRACGGMAPGLKPGSPMPHYHRAATESFKVLSGTFMYSADGKEHAAHAGETVVIPPGVTHTFWVGESDSNSMTILVKFEPAGPTGEASFETLAGLSRDYQCLAKAPVLQMLLWMEAQDMQLAAIPPPARWLARRTLVPLALALGYKATYPEYGLLG
ncbi:hypothetical protein V8C86DRAFT_3138044 [Haematococcus lacustris]